MLGSATAGAPYGTSLTPRTHNEKRLVLDQFVRETWMVVAMSELRRLQVLVELARHGTIAAVAEATSYSTSAISQQLMALEKDLGVKLLEPDGRRIKLTAAGRAVADSAPAVLDAWEHTRDLARQRAATLSGPVRIGVFQTAYLALVPPLVDALAARCPEVVLHVVQAEPEEGIEALRVRELDAVLLEHYPDQPAPRPKDVRVEALMGDPMLLALPPALAGTPLADLHDATWAMEPPGTAARAWAEHLCEAHGFSPRVSYDASDILLQVELVSQGRAVALIPRLTPGDARARVSTTPLLGHRRIVQLATRDSSAGNPLLAILRDCLREIADGVA